MHELKRNPAKVMGVVTAVLALAAVYIPGLPQEAILAVVAAVLFGGHQVQRIEDQKTEEALAETPELEGHERQLALLLAENAALRAGTLPKAADTAPLLKVSGVDLEQGTCTLAT
ncbi:hypothetical protein EF910_05685 [Streptomyces sp. WAC07149]|uniref:hypothetical protein n=1 Tax=Streptomyces sp. WAC07149 TaxID=2487425 RepID=UPI000F770E3D|nr:hypothetical protein [Streptomyces sp. WAC07149]RST07928.1 hypothetical protein EF910_05685 [Streptomyces sp. WAC07149]